MLNTPGCFKFQLIYLKKKIVHIIPQKKRKYKKIQKKDPKIFFPKNFDIFIRTKMDNFYINK